MPRYLIPMITGKDLNLTDSDLYKLMSATDESFDATREELIADSGVFCREIALNQCKKQLPKGFFQKHLASDAKLWVLNASGDRIIGSTWEKNEEIYSGINLHTGGGHMKALMEFERTLELLRCAGCEI